MWTNVFKIGGLHQLSWFQFLPNESDFNSLLDKSGKVEQKDGATRLVLSAHLQLLKDGFLSAWTNSFVGPWDPSQGLHNPDDKIKLWLFLPGRHSSVVNGALPALSKLKVVASGVWLAPGDSEEVAAALSQSLKNCIEKALLGQSFVRFGDVFTKCHPSQTGGVLWKGQPTVELIFAATEEAVFLHVIISAKHIRALSSADMDNVQKQLSRSSGCKLPVMVSPHGLRGWLTGCCPNDLVQQVYLSSSRFGGSHRAVGLPQHVSEGLGGQSWGQNGYAEVMLGCPKFESGKEIQSSSQFSRNVSKTNVLESSVWRSPDHLSEAQKTFIYSAEAIIVPIPHTLSARASLKRFWLQNWMGPSASSSFFFMHCGSDTDWIQGHWAEIYGLPFQHDNNSSSNSNNSSISSISRSSSDSDHRMMTETGDLEADADSLSCRQSGLSTDYQYDKNGPKSGVKRHRAGITDTFGQVTMNSVQDAYNSTITGLEGFHIDLDWDDDGGVNIDAQALLSDFGDFGCFFETDKLDFGEPPGTAESQVPVFSASDCEVGSSPVGVIDVADQMLMPVGFSSFDSFNPPLLTPMDESLSKNQEITSSTPASHNPSTGEFDHLIKAEALMTFAPEYGAVETPTSEFSSSIFRRPYHPKSRKVESSSSSTTNYKYGAVPPDSLSDEKDGMVINPQRAKGRLDARNYYTQVESGREHEDKRLSSSNAGHAKNEDMTLSSFSNPIQNKVSEGTIAPENVLFSSRTVLGTDIECIMFQASMCKMRHILKSSSVNMSSLSGSNILNQFPGDGSTMTDNVSARNEMKKKESIPVRIAGDTDGILDAHLNAPVGVWRSVGVPKVMKPFNSASVEVSPSLPHHTFSNEELLSYGHRQLLQDFLNAMPLLVQQATSFVDVALDGCCDDGPLSWLALQEQCRRGFCCGPSSVHAGCGGTLASSHFLDIAGVEVADPLCAEILPSTVINLLQSEIKTALKAAFKTVEGPLSVNDWFKGRSSFSGAMPADGSCSESTLSESKDYSVSAAMDGSKGEDSSQKSTPLVLPAPAILVGYQDDWLKTSAGSLQFWDKAPFEPYALPKPLTYYVVCPEIDPLTSAAADFFQQLGIVYETCKLGTHSPRSSENEMEIDLGKRSSSGFVLLDCPQSMKIESTNASLVGSISDYFLSLSNGWDLTSYLKSLSKAIKALKIAPLLSSSAKEGNSGPCVVVYVVCPFPDPTAVLQTIIESSVAVGSVSLPLDIDRRSTLHSQVGKALNCSATMGEASASNVLVLSGFSVPKLILQIVTVDAIFRVSSPALNELVALKEIAFTVYNKARRISKASSNKVLSSSLCSSRPPDSVITQMSSVPGMWKDIGPRIGGPSLPRDSEIDSSLRPGNWDNSWQTRSGGMNGDQNRNGEHFLHDDIRYMFEPLFILSEPGSTEHALAPSSESSKLLSDDIGGFTSIGSTGSTDTGLSSQADGSDDGFGTSNLPTLHCCYGWTEDWRWLVSIWTDARGELLDSHIFPFGGISSRQDTKSLQCVFMQVLQQGCQILQACSSPDTGVAKPRDFVISRIGSFFQLEYLEWQKAIYAVGGSEVKKWALQLRRSMSDGSGASSQSQEMGLNQDRTMGSHPKSLNYMKGGDLGQASSRKHLIGGNMIDAPRGMLQWVHSISFATISVDHSLQLTFPSDLPPSGIQGGNGIGGSGYLEGFTPVKSLGSTSASYILIPSASMRFLSPTPLQLPTCLTAESPPLAHLLHSRGSAVPLSTGFVVSKAVPSMRKDYKRDMGEEWPAVLSVSLVDYYGGTRKQGAQDIGMQTRSILESISAELHALSWMTASPAYLERRTALPFHCDMVLRLRRLLHFADKELLSQPDRPLV